MSKALKKEHPMAGGVGLMTPPVNVPPQIDLQLERAASSHS